MGIVGLLSGGIGFLKGNWIRLVLLAGIAVAIFGMGYMKASEVHARHDADKQKAITAEIIRREMQIHEKWLLRMKNEENARLTLKNNFDTIRDQRDSLLESIRNRDFVKPISNVNVEGCLETDDEDVQVVIANPFNAAFSSMWNDAGSDPTRTDSETRPEAD